MGDDTSHHVPSRIDSACSARRTAGSVIPAASSSSAQRLEHQKCVGNRGQRDVVMPAGPRAPLEVIELERVFQFSIILRDAPAPLGEAHELAQSERLVRERRE